MYVLAASFLYLFIHALPHSVSRQVPSPFHSEFFKECALVLSLSISSILSFLEGHPVAVYVFFLVFQSFISFL